MCGRYASTKDPARLAAEFAAVDATEGMAPGPDHNVAPTKRVVAVVERPQRGEDGEPEPSGTERTLRVLRWGLVPSWAKERSIGSRMINARAETVATKPAFRRSVARHRCLVPADGWFEWKRADGRKQPFYLTRTDGASLAFAGIFATWRDPAAGEDTPPLVTCAVVTTAAVGPLTEVHDRMPLLLDADQWARWLDPANADVADLLATPPADGLVEALELRPVSSAVNSVRNNGPELVVRHDPTPADLFDPGPTG